MTDRLLQRRTFLKALGIGLAAPLAAKMARLAVAAPGDRPTRLFIYYVPHGVPNEHFEPLAGAQGLDFAQSGLGMLSPFEAYKDYVTVVRGLSMNDGATNHAAIRAVLTGFNEGSGADSIDFTIAQGLGVPAHTLGAMPYNTVWGFGSNSWLIKHGSWVRPTESPEDAAEELLGGIVAPGPDPDPEPTVDEAVFREETLALTEGELESMHDELQGLTREQNKLALHLEAVRALKAKSSGGGGQLSGGGQGCDSLPTLDALEAARGLEPLEQANFGKILDAQLQVAAQAIKCGTTRVLTLQNMWVNSDLNFGFSGGPGVNKGHHEPVSHSWDAPGREEFAICQRWFYERLAERFLDTLMEDDPADPGRKIIDNSLVYICSEISDGANHHSNAQDMWLNGQQMFTYLPTILIGGAGGYLNTGRAVTVDRMHTDMLATLADAMGVSVSSIGGQSVSPITELKA